MDFSPLLMFLFGGLILWFFWHWRSADNTVARHQDDQLNISASIASKSSSLDDRAARVSSYDHDSNSFGIDASLSSTTVSSINEGTTAQTAYSEPRVSQSRDASINGVAFTVIEQELDELYQLSAKVKPLEYELSKTREQLKQLKSTQEFTSDDLDDSWVELKNDHATQIQTAPDTHKSIVGFLSGSDYAVHVTPDETETDELGELYQLVAKVKPLEYELSRNRKSNNSLAADKERVERRLRSQLELNNRQQETHKLELARGLASQSTKKDAKIAELQSIVEEAQRKSITLEQNSAELIKNKADLQQLREENTALQEKVEKAQHENAELTRDVVDLTKIKSDQVQLAQAKQQLQETNILLQAKAEKVQQENAELTQASADLSEIKSDHEQLAQIKQQLLEENAVLQSELKTQQEKSDKKQAESDAAAMQRKNELHSLQLQMEDQKIQLDNAKKRLREINKKQTDDIETRSKLQKTIASKDEQILKLSTQLDELSQTNNAATRDKDEADNQARKMTLLLSKAETRAAEMQVQQTQAEQQWRYEMSSLQAALAGFEESKAKASSKEAELEQLVSIGKSQREALESRLKAAEENTAQLEQALESSESSAMSFSEYSKIAERKVIQLSNAMSERDTEIERITARVTAAESQLQQQLQQSEQARQKQSRDVQALTLKFSDAESLLEKRKEQLRQSEEGKRQLLDDAKLAKLHATELMKKLQQSEAELASKDAAIEGHLARLAVVDESQSSIKAQLTKIQAQALQSKRESQSLTDSLKQAQLRTKELEEMLGKAESASTLAKQAAQQGLSELEQKRLSDAHKISELQLQLTQANATASQTSADSYEITELKEQLAALKKETSKYAAFQKEAQATALELIEAKEQLKKLDMHAKAAATASDSLTNSNIEIARLQKELEKAKRFQVDLQEQSVVLGKLKSQLKQSTDTASTVDDYRSRMGALEQQLKERNAELKTTQSQVEKNAKRDGNRIDKAKLALSVSKKRINELGKALSKAEAGAKKAEQNDLELRRLRSELRTLQAQRDKNVKSLDTSVSNTKTPDATALKKLESEIQQRDQKIEQLTSRLAKTQQASSSAGTASKKPNSRIQRSNAKQPQESPVLFSVPKEKDDLKRIKGIGPVMEKMLNRLGIASFKQIADFSKADIQRVSDAIETFPGRIERDDWIGGAKQQFKIKYKDKAEA